MIKNWQNKISPEIKSKVNLDILETKYYSKIKHYLKKGLPDNISLRRAKKEMIVYLDQYDIKNSDIIYILHFCGLKIYPKMYNGCGCHSYLNKAIRTLGGPIVPSSQKSKTLESRYCSSRY